VIQKKDKGTVVTIGEVMMRLSPPPFQRLQQTHQFDVHYGGSEANVAVSLAQWGLDTEHVSRFPENELGQAAIAHLRSHGVSTQHVDVGDGRLGTYFLEHGTDQRSSKVLYDRAGSAFAHIDPSRFDWEEILADAKWLHWSGITPAISQAAADTCYDAIRAARKLGVTISGDINYRRNLWQYGKTARDVMPTLIAETDVVIGGLTDFENCVGIAASDFTDACRQLQRQFPAVKTIANTYREELSSSQQKISASWWDGKSLLTGRTYTLTSIADRVGAGDAFVAGLIYGSLTEWTKQVTLDFALAACTLKHSVPGDVNRVSVSEVQALVKGVNIGKLLR